MRLCAVAILALAAGCSTLSADPGPTGTPAGAPPLAENLRTGLPTLLDLGAGQCIPCKMMAPILKELQTTHKDRFTVIFIDVWKDRSPGVRHRIRVIPTQIFFDADGRELFRHEGFMSKSDILKKWSELGVGL